MDKIFLEEYGKENMNAGFKARKDVCDIIRKMDDVAKINVSFTTQDDKNRAYKLIKYFGLYIKLLFLKKGSVIIVQYPCRQIARLLKVFEKKFRIVAIVHDIEGLRQQDSEQLNNDVAFFNLSHTVITHNKRMSDKLRQCGVSVPTLVELNLFDYLCEERKSENDEKGVCFAGNIDKSVFLAKLPEEVAECGFNLYGLYKEKTVFPDGIRYIGAYDSSAIVEKLQGKFALVWDGESVDTCSGKMGEYTKFNNPHKLSLYVAAGIPVIVWQQAAIADFVSDNGIGVCVESLSEIPLILKGMNGRDYDSIKKKIKAVQKKVITGEFLNSALRTALGE